MEDIKLVEWTLELHWVDYLSWVAFQRQRAKQSNKNFERDHMKLPPRRHLVRRLIFVSAKNRTFQIRNIIHFYVSNSSIFCRSILLLTLNGFFFISFSTHFALFRFAHRFVIFMFFFLEFFRRFKDFEIYLILACDNKTKVINNKNLCR